MGRPIARALVLAVAVAAGAAGCGADTVDRHQEAVALAHYCRSVWERASDLPDVAVSVARIEDFLATHPGEGADASAISTVRALCKVAAGQRRAEVDASLSSEGP